jgi:hypothetical protein
MQILYHQDQRAAGGHGLKKAAPCGELLGLLSGRDVAAGQAKQGGEPQLQPFALILVGDEGRDGRREFGRDQRRVIRLEHTGLCLDDLAQRPEGDAIAVGQAVALAPDHQLGLLVDEPQQFPDEPALADPRLTDDGHQLHRTRPPRLLVEPAEQVEFLVATHQRGRRPLLDIHPQAAARGDRAPDREGLGFALDLNRLQLLVVECGPRRPPGRLPDDYGAGRGRALEARGRIHDVADHALGLVRAGIQDHGRLARHDPNPDGKLKLRGRLVQLGDGIEHPKRTPNRPLRVILMRARHPEHGHDAVANELVYGATQPFDLSAKPLMVRTQQGPHVLRVGLVGAGGEANQVAEQHRDDLALLHGGSRRATQRRPTAPAEPEALRILLAAARAAHDESSMVVTQGGGECDAGLAVCAVGVAAPGVFRGSVWWAQLKECEPGRESAIGHHRRGV